MLFRSPLLSVDCRQPTSRPQIPMGHSPHQASMAALTLVLLLVTLLSKPQDLRLRSGAAGESHPFTKSFIEPKLTQAVNHKGYVTYNVESSLTEQFTSVQHCLPIQLIFLETETAFLDYAVVDVNSTSLEGSYTIHPYVENRQLVRRPSYVHFVCFLS